MASASEKDERARTEAAYTASEEEYRAIFAAIDEGYCVCELIFDEAGAPVDLLYVKANSSFERLVGIANTAGKTSSKLFPNFEPHWLEPCVRVIATGESERYERFSGDLDRWFDIFVSRIGGFGSPLLTTVVKDTTERKRAEISLRESEARQTFLLKLSDTLRPLGDAMEIQTAAVRVLGEHLAVNRAFYNVIDEKRDAYVIHRSYTNGVAPLIGHFRLSEIRRTAELAGSGQIVVFDDASADPRLSAAERAAYVAMEVAAGVGVPLIKDERWVAGLGVHHATPRQWTPEEINLIRETAERTWAAVERAHAETALGSGAARDAFRVQLTDALRGAANPEEALGAAMRVLGNQFEASRVMFGEGDQGSTETFTNHREFCRAPAKPSSVGQHRWDAFGLYVETELRAGRNLVVDDVQTHPNHSPEELAAYEAIDVQAYLAVPLVRQKRIMAYLVVNHTRPHTWTPDEIALAEETAERIWAAVERARAEAALLESEAKYRTLFEKMSEGFIVLERVADEPLDYRILIANSAYEHQTGFSNPVGRTVRDIAPTSEDALESYRIAEETGLTQTFTAYFREIGRWFEVEVSSAERPGQIAVLFRCITERKRAETALRESAERQAFLLKLSDALRAEPSAEAIANRALRMVFEHMGLDRCCIVTYRLTEDIVDFPHQVHDDRLPPISAQLHSSDFPEMVQVLLDQTLVIDDVVTMEGLSASEVAAFTGLGLRALINATLRKGENNPIWALVAASARARAWTPGEVSLVEDVAERTWAAVERARAEAALRDSEERFRLFSDASTNVLWIRDTETMQLEFASPAFDKIYGTVGPECGGDGRLRSWARLIEPKNRKTVLANVRRVREGERVEQEFQIRRASDGTLRWIHDTGFPLRNANGDVRYIAGLGADITDAKETTDRQGVLVAELQHRTRNLIAVVRALSDRTLGNAASLEDFGARFRLRLSALSRVQGLLSHLTTGKKVTFKELLCSELAVYGATDGMAHKFTLEGPDDVPLRSRTVQTFALAIHELATNALKYGALAAADGHLFVGWRIDPPVGNDPPCLHVEWRESGVTMPDVGAPARGGGYGRELIERALRYQLKAKTTYELGVDGVRCTIAVPISQRARNGIPGGE